jgi:hypothetical protein
LGDALATVRDPWEPETTAPTIRDVRSKRERELRRVHDAASHRGTGNIGHPKTVSARSDDAIRTRLAR